MKVLKETIPPWVNTQVSCSACKSKFKLEDGDRVRYLNGYGCWHVYCPVCRADIMFKVKGLP